MSRTCIAGSVEHICSPRVAQRDKSITSAEHCDEPQHDEAMITGTSLVCSCESRARHAMIEMRICEAWKIGHDDRERTLSEGSWCEELDGFVRSTNEWKLRRQSKVRYLGFASYKQEMKRMCRISREEKVMCNALSHAYFMSSLYALGDHTYSSARAWRLSRAIAL